MKFCTKSQSKRSFGTPCWTPFSLGTFGTLCWTPFSLGTFRALRWTPFSLGTFGTPGWTPYPLGTFGTALDTFFPRNFGDPTSHRFFPSEKSIHLKKIIFLRKKMLKFFNFFFEKKLNKNIWKTKILKKKKIQKKI